MIGAPPGAAQPPITPAQMEAQRQAKTAAEGLARHSKIPVDRNLPDGVDQCIIGDGAQRFKDLKDVERRLDATMMRKRLDVQDAMSRVPKVNTGQTKLTGRLLTRPAISYITHLDQ